ncbi:GDP-mannose 4,6-dehydratase [Alphaproteobacteria bacterium]|nr:GDP-mannose 4,6-dehydratase [Alphaproteobacteria bacterium]
MSSKKSTVLISGGAGFIGSHTVDLFLSKGFKVKCIDNLSGGNENNISHLKKNKNFFFEKADILNLAKFKSFLKDCSYVVHFAGIGDIVPSIENPKKYIENNVNGTLNLIQNLNLKKIKKFTYAASSSCYGIAKTPTKETHPIKTLYPYALSKYMGEQLALHWGRVYKLKVNSVRIFNAYGTRSRTTGAYGAVFGVFLKQLLENKPLTVVGDGTQKRDFLYVTDVANAFYKSSISTKKGEIWNIGSGNPQSINKLVKLLKPVGIINLPKRPGEPDVTFANINKINKDLTWKPKISFEDGVQKVLNDINYWRKAPLWNKDSIKKATKTWFEYMN